MELWETRVEIAPEAAGPVELALLESGFGGWSLLEDALAKRAWIVGIFQDRAEADSRWRELRPTLPVETP
jgi:ribosomal protein L11 methyltransferase